MNNLEPTHPASPGLPVAFYSPIGRDDRVLLPGSYWAILFCEPAGEYQGYSAIEAPNESGVPRNPAGLTVTEALVVAPAVQALVRARGREAPDPEVRAFLANVLIGLCATTERPGGGVAMELVVAPGVFEHEMA